MTIDSHLSQSGMKASFCHGSQVHFSPSFSAFQPPSNSAHGTSSSHMENVSSLLFAGPYSLSGNPVSQRCFRIQGSNFQIFYKESHAYMYITQYPRGPRASNHLQTYKYLCSKPGIFILSVIRLQVASVSPGLILPEPLPLASPFYYITHTPPSCSVPRKLSYVGFNF